MGRLHSSVWRVSRSIWKESKPHFSCDRCTLRSRLWNIYYKVEEAELERIHETQMWVSNAAENKLMFPLVPFIL